MSDKQLPILPLGPICSYGNRLAYTYFNSSPQNNHIAPSPESLNLNYSKVILGAVPSNAGSTSISVGGAGTGGTHWFTIDDQLLYLSFFQDSGPLNAACLYRFCLHVHTLLEDPELKSKKIVLYSSDEPDKKSNSALLIALYAMIVMRWSPADVLHPIAVLELQPFRDAGYARADYHLSLQSTIYGIHRAISSHLLDLATFDLLSYETYEKVENGDWNYITPGFLAFASPVEPSYIASTTGGGAGVKVEGGRPRLSKAFRNVLEEFEKGGIRAVVRLNKKLYDSAHFTERGIDHVEMYFDDGTNPPMEMTRTFIDLSDRIISSGGTVAVHCKAGLGRTGTLIGAYLIYKHGFTASEAIGFMRLMRPGSCVGPQQHFLYENQMTWVRWAAVDAHKASLPQVLVIPPPVVAVPIESINLESSRRPITPPNEIDLQRTHQSQTQGRSSRHTTPIHSLDQPPRTPGRTVQVPGQPRKTPGKSKHSVASPEVRDLIIEEEPLESNMLITDDMMLVQEEEEVEEAGEDDGPRTPTASTSNLAQPKFSGGVNASNLTSPTKSKSTTSSSTTIAIGSTTTASTTNTTSRPTRIASRSRTTRPLSAITDNRMVDRIGNTRSSTTDFKGSSKNAVKDLVTVFESNSRNTSAEVEVSVSGGRYDLRGGRTSPSELPSPTTTTTTIINGMGQASPSRLPQRIPAKRRGAAGGIDSTTVVGGKSCAMEMNSVGLGGVGRSVRRRRSSLGSTDFVVPGPGEL